jgi:hypothetical protein
MSNETQVIDEPLFYYYGNDGVKYYTCSAVLAMARAKFHGTDDVYVVS